jgi:hypothetical protein
MSEIFHDYRNNEMNPIKRALLGVTCFEICGSFGWFLTGWALPEGTDFALANGSVSSCNFQGFLLQLVVGAPMFNTLLQYLVYLLVTKNCHQKDLRSFENKAYMMIVLFAVIAAIVPMALKQYNPMSQMCWLNGYPSGCNESVFGGSDIPCERGFNAQWSGIFLFFFIIWSCMITIIALNVMIVQSLLNSGSSAREAKWVGIQGMMYSAAFLVTWTPSTLMTIMAYASHGGFHFDILAVVFEPLQGFWNMLILLRSNPTSVDRLKALFSFQYCRSSLQAESISSQDMSTQPISNKTELNSTEGIETKSIN